MMQLVRSPLNALEVFFIEPLNSRYGWGELLLKATPLALCALGLALGFSANVWNIGAEGQLTLGAICGGFLGGRLWTCYTPPASESPRHDRIERLADGATLRRVVEQVR